MTSVFQTLTTPDGPFTFIEDEAGRVIASGWTEDITALTNRIRPAERPDKVIAANALSGSSPNARAVLDYYAGNFSALDDVAVRQFGTNGQLAGWDQLRLITPGHPLTYSEFAEALGKPQAVRAAASICARNAVALFVPCHRVMRSDGTMGGFAWGEHVKKSLLTREHNA